MSNVHVLDASAILCVFFKEKGHQNIAPLLATSIVSSVNFAEAVSKLHEHKVAEDIIATVLEGFKPDVIDFDREAAVQTAALRNSTRSKGLSLGDRACLALAASRKAVAVTADKAWQGLDDIAPILLIR